jgi:FtsP/CotA-like multicopper oxidase with cupredoxin domain
MPGQREPIRGRQGQRVLFHISNGSDDRHPSHLFRHSFESVRVGGNLTSGVIKDIVMLGGFQKLEVEFMADDPGRTLFHCHEQLHMDFGLIALIEYV